MNIFFLWKTISSRKFLLTSFLLNNHFPFWIMIWRLLFFTYSLISNRLYLSPQVFGNSLLCKTQAKASQKVALDQFHVFCSIENLTESKNKILKSSKMYLQIQSWNIFFFSVIIGKIGNDWKIKIKSQTLPCWKLFWFV